MKFQSFFVIWLGATFALPKTCSTVSFLPAKLIAYPPNGLFFFELLDLVRDLLFGFLFDTKIPYLVKIAYFIILIKYLCSDTSGVSSG